MTNPALDSVRERSVMSLAAFLGNNTQPLLAPATPEACARLWLDSPLLDGEQMAELRRHRGLRCHVLDCTFAALDAPGTLLSALDAVVAAGVAAVQKGATVLVLSDVSVSPTRAPIPAVLVVSRLSNVLAQHGLGAGLVVETGESWDVHHLTLLVSFGASAIYPYNAYRGLELCSRNRSAFTNYKKAVEEGFYKVVAKVRGCVCMSVCVWVCTYVSV